MTPQQPQDYEHTCTMLPCPVCEDHLPHWPWNQPKRGQVIPFPRKDKR